MKSQLRVPEMPDASSEALERWFHQLYVDCQLFNPDDRPEDIVDIETGKPVFSDKECLILNRSLDWLFKRHGDKDHDVALKYFHKAMGITPEYASA